MSTPTYPLAPLQVQERKRGPWHRVQSSHLHMLPDRGVVFVAYCGLTVADYPDYGDTRTRRSESPPGCAACRKRWSR